jgi:hypothetical protein
MTVCSYPIAGRAGRADYRCRHDLTAQTPAAASAPGELIALQALLVAILDPTVTEVDAVALVDWLVDLLVIAARVGLDFRVIDRDRRNLASVLAGPLSQAYRALIDPHGPRLRAIAIADLAPTRGALPSVWDGVSPALAAVLLKHRDALLRTADRLRYRSMTGAGRRPEGADPSRRLRALPLALWPDWSIRMRPPTIDPNSFRIAASIALCVPGATAAMRSIRGHWPGPRFTQRLSQFGRRVTTDPHGTAILGAICALADNLDRDGAPIDYERRRSLASQIVLLDADAWTVMCRAGGTLAGAGRKLADARLWLWETLTGGLPAQAPPALRPDHPEFLTNHARFGLRLPGPTARHLLEHARRLLDAHGCQDEPLTWSPKSKRIALDQLPGPDPDAIDPGQVHAALARRLTPTQVAEELAITLEHLRYLARKHPSESPHRPARTAPPRTRLAALLSRGELRELVNQGTSLRAIAARYDINRQTIHDELIAHGIPIPPRDKLRRAIDRDWLAEQYITKRRTTVDIAGELDVSRSTISKLLHQHGIPVRPSGSASHQQNLTAGDGFPEPLASAVHGRGGADRVRRFQVYAGARSLTAGAKRLAVGQYALTLQLAKLERTCQAQLLERPTRDRQHQRPTTLGQTLLDQADQYLGPHPNAPQEPPEPLATVLNAHFADKKLATFLVVVAWPTINDGALKLGIQPGSLQRAIRNLERILGEPVLTDRRGAAPMHLTPIGRRLLRQARQHKP